MGAGADDDQTYLSLTTALGPEVLKLYALEGEDGISTLFRYRLKLRTDKDKDVSFSQLIGKPATITIRMHEGKRIIDGILTCFELTHVDEREGLTYYEAELRPWLYLLTLSGDCRIFQEKSVPDIVVEVCRKAGFNHVRPKLTETYPPRDYCVQYEESDYNFIARLLEEEGIFYLFDHTEGGGARHELVLGDDRRALRPCPGVSSLRYRPQLAVDDGDDVLTGIRYEKSVTTRSVGVDSHNFQSPATALYSSAEGRAGFGKMNHYTGDFTRSAEGERQARIRQQAAAAPAALVHGFGQARSLSAGCRFTLKDHPRPEVNGGYVLRRLRIEATRERYRASFDALPLAVPFRPAGTAHRPRIHSSQTAVVVGKPGEELWVDSFGRIKVQFHWDREGRRDHQSSCWIRVAQGWAGKAYGAMFLPRVGQEVIVSFLDGDPDRPIVTGAVYNADQTVPYVLPANATRSTIRTQSPGEGGFNELRFEDKPGHQEVFIHAGKDLTTEVLDNLATSVGGDETHHVKKTRDGGGRRSVTVEGPETHGNREDFSHQVDKDLALTVKGAELHRNHGMFEHQVARDYLLKVDGNLTIAVTGAVTLSGQSLTFRSAGASEIQAGSRLQMNAAEGLGARSGGGLDLRSVGAMDLQSATDLQLKAQLALSAQGMTASLKGQATGEVSASSLLTLKGAITRIG